MYKSEELIKSYKCDKKVYDYLKEILSHLKISITNRFKNSDIFELMDKEALDGWCWETTGTAILFFKDDDYIERGYLKLDEKTNYYHSWIVFDFEDEEYVFDPCLNIISKRNIYHEYFNPEIKGKVSSMEVKNYIVEYIKNPPKKEISPIGEQFSNFIRSNLSKETLERVDSEVTLQASEDVYSPVYRNHSGYIAEIKDNKIENLKVYYYENL